jgi:hypothetical protein
VVEAWGSVRWQRCSGVLLLQFGALDDVLDVLLLGPALIVVAPPDWSLVFAFETEMSAGFASRLSFVALLPAQSACEAALYEKSAFWKDGAKKPCIKRWGL